MNARALLTTTLALLAGLAGGAQAPATVPYDHIHLTAPDPEKAYAWYEAHLGGREGENPGRLIFEPFTGRRPLPVQLMFIKGPDAPASIGGAIESLGFSVSGVAARAQQLQAAGARLAAPVRDVPGEGAQATVVDPWGVTIELVDDPERRGLHHVTLRVADVSASVEWFAGAFGGERTRVGGAEALRYDRTAIVFRQGDAAPSRGRAIDHLGWMPPGMDALAARLNGRGITFTAGPQPKPNQFGHRTAYIEAPGGARIELVEHTECTWGLLGL